MSYPFGDQVSMACMYAHKHYAELNPRHLALCLQPLCQVVKCMNSLLSSSDDTDQMSLNRFTKVLSKVSAFAVKLYLFTYFVGTKFVL
jgi:hypothetical protein